MLQKRNKFGRTTNLTLSVLYTLSISTFLFSLFCYFQLEIRGVVFKTLLLFSFANTINFILYYSHKNIIYTYVIASLLGYFTLILICLYSDGINSPAISFLVLLIFFGYLINNRYGNMWLVIVLITVLAFYIISATNYQLTNEINTQNIAEFNLIFLLFLILLLGGVFGRMLNKTNEKVRKAKLEIIKKNEEKSVMLKEIHHRVKNNLQVVNSLLRIQSRNIDDDGIKKVLKAAQNRIVAMARLHENIYNTKDLKNINIAKYLNILITDLIYSNSINTDISLKLNISKIGMSIDILLPVSLIINELVSNSLKHAFYNVKKGEIYIELIEVSHQKCKLTVVDNGCAAEKDILFSKSSSTGVTLIKTLTRQLNGHITALPLTHGTGFEIYFLNTIV